MLRTSVASAAVVAGTVLATGVASASPPHGVVLFDGQARGHAVGTAVASVRPGTGAFAGSYTLAPGSGTGWRAQPGMSVLAVTAGSLRVLQASGCSARDYTAGEVAFLPAGTFQVSNGGSAAATFVGYFDNLPKGAGLALLDGAQAKAPKGCRSGGAAYQAASTGLTAVDLGHGAFTPAPPANGRHHLTAADSAKRAVVPDGGDVVIVNVIATPGSSTGWYRHVPGIALISKGRLDVYEATDSGCAKVEEGRAGDAVSHVHHDVHYTLVAGDEPLEAVLIYWAMGGEKLPTSVAGPQIAGVANFVEANDFTPVPPPACTML